MKNRKSVSHENILAKSAIDFVREKSDIRTKRKSSESSFLRKSADILKDYKVFTKPPTRSFGDANFAFKQSLRSYNNDFEFSKALKRGQTHLRAHKSTEFLKTERRHSFSPTPLFCGDGDSILRRKLKLLSEQTQNERKSNLLKKRSNLTKDRSLRVEVVHEEVEEPEVDVFYSPSSELDVRETKLEVTAESEQNESLPLESTKKEEEAEEFIPANCIDETLKEFESDSERDFKMADEDLQLAEDAVEHAATELTEVTADTTGETSDFSEVDETTTEAVTVDAESDVTATEMFTTGETTEVTDISERVLNDTTDDESVSVAITITTDKAATEAAAGKTGPTEYDPNIDAAVIKELEDAEQQAMETAKIIFELKQRVAQLLSKAKMTEAEGRELELKNKQLKEQMALFEAKTKRIQFLVDQASLFENMISPRPALEKKHTEDMLPKVIICGMTENNMPKIIVCDDKKRTNPTIKAQPTARFALPEPASVMPQFAKRLSESYYMQERLAAENADLEGKRYKLQEDLLDKDHTVDNLQRKLNSLQGEMRMVCKENSLLSEKLQRIESCPQTFNKGDTSEGYTDSAQSAPPCKKHQKGGKMPCGKSKGPCPADVESRLQEYSATTQQLEKQLCEMECEVRNMQTELIQVQKERQHLEQHKRMLNAAAPPCGPPPCVPPPCGGPCGGPCGAPCGPPPCVPPPCGGPCGAPCGPPCAPPPCAPTPCGKPPCPGPCNPNRKNGGASEQQLRELREQYNRLQDDFKSKLTEVAGLRADTEKLKQSAKDAEEAKKVAEDKVKEYEKELKNYKSEKNKFMGSKEQLVEQEQQLNVAKQRFREAQDELEELRALIQDQQAQLDDYRNKYLQAQQQVEEQRRQIDMMELENNRISEQVNLEIQRVKNQFQEKLQELTPLPDILKSTQLKLQEAQQMHLLAERNNEGLVHELQAYRDKAAAMANQIEKVRSDQQLGADEKASVEARMAEFERKYNEAVEELEQLKTELVRMEEVAEQNEKRVQEKLHEIAQLVSQLETVREESARQVARTKDRCETVRRSMQNQIADLERQLAQSRAQARAAQKDRDDIRQKMQSQINNLNENFEDAQMRIRNLQGHVNFLKNSYTTVFPPSDPMLGDGMVDGCGNTY